MLTERSAGTIIFRRNKQIKYLLLHYEAGHWDFPKGNIEKGETERTAAKRELKEETGIVDGKFIERFKERIKYFYRKKGKLIFKEVIYFLIETKTKKVKISFEHKDFKWLNFDKAMRQLTFKNSKRALEKANKLIH